MQVPLTSVVPSIGFFIVADVLFRRIFIAKGIGFPSALAGMGALFTTLLTLSKIQPRVAESIYRSLTPGADFFAKWLAVFFTPALVALPLAAAPSPSDCAKLMVLLVGGWGFSLASTIATVNLISRGGGKPAVAAAATAVTSAAAVGRGPVVADGIVRGGDPAKAKRVTPPPAKPFPASTKNNLGRAAIGFGALAAGGYRTLGPYHPAVQLSEALFALSLTLFGFVRQSLAPAKAKALVHPIVACVLTTWTGLAAVAVAGGVSMASMMELYRGSGAAGSLLVFMLGPSVRWGLRVGGWATASNVRDSWTRAHAHTRSYTQTRTRTNAPWS